jgi:hypothetical protein
LQPSGRSAPTPSKQRLLSHEMLNILSAELPQYPAALHNSDPEQGLEQRGIHRHLGAVNKTVSMEALPLTDAPAITLSRPGPASLNQSLAPSDLKWLGERLRAAYSPVEAPLPARLAELAERLARWEQIEN